MHQRSKDIELTHVLKIGYFGNVDKRPMLRQAKREPEMISALLFVASRIPRQSAFIRGEPNLPSTSVP